MRNANSFMVGPEELRGALENAILASLGGKIPPDQRDSTARILRGIWNETGAELAEKVNARLAAQGTRE